MECKGNCHFRHFTLSYPVGPAYQRCTGATPQHILKLSFPMIDVEWDKGPLLSWHTMAGQMNSDPVQSPKEIARMRAPVR